jgi:hypothetical protein
MDGARPSDVDFLRTGVFNLGFIGLKASDQSRAMLDWWESRCLGMGFNDPAFGTFVDQKWMNLVPCYFSSVRILRHPGCNVAYWNLHERDIEDLGAGRYQVNGEDLVCFHFSGLVPTNPTALSKYQNRHELIAGSVISELVRDYCARLFELGHARYAAFPYGFGVLDDGTPVNPTMRRALLVVPYEEQNPFGAASRLQRELLDAGIAVKNGGVLAKPRNTLNFDERDFRVRMFNSILRVIHRVVGLSRLLSLLQYAALLNREANLPAVLLRKPINLLHKLHR